MGTFSLQTIEISNSKWLKVLHFLLARAKSILTEPTLTYLDSNGPEKRIHYERRTEDNMAIIPHFPKLGKCAKNVKTLIRIMLLIMNKSSHNFMQILLKQNGKH